MTAASIWSFDLRMPSAARSICSGGRSRFRGRMSDERQAVRLVSANGGTGLASRLSMRWGLSAGATLRRSMSLKGPTRSAARTASVGSLFSATCVAETWGRSSKKAQSKMASVQLPAGQWIVVGRAVREPRGSEAATHRRGSDLLLPDLPAALLDVQERRYALLVFNAVPLGLTGGIVALWLRGICHSPSRRRWGSSLSRRGRSQRARDGVVHQPVAGEGEGDGDGGRSGSHVQRAERSPRPVRLHPLRFRSVPRRDPTGATCGSRDPSSAASAIPTSHTRNEWASVIAHGVPVRAGHEIVGVTRVGRGGPEAQAGTWWLWVPGGSGRHVPALSRRVEQFCPGMTLTH